MSLEERKVRRRALDKLGVPDFGQFLEEAGVAHQLARKQTEVFQVNIGLYCNQACSHCHVESSPKRTESMTRETVDRCLELMANTPSLHTLDITGGAPELNPEFRRLVTKARSELPHIKDIIDRCNLTVLMEPGQEDLPEFLAEHNVRVVASLPCYSAKNVNQQRGKGVFDRSINALRILNSLGYAQPGTGLHLDLVYNPLGAFLPPPQEALEEKYREELMEAFGISFNSLFTITNQPIKRFADFLHRRNELQGYMDLLVRNFNADTVEGLMCGNTVSFHPL
jgi:radical SAM/Cys-rich protein